MQVIVNGSRTEVERDETVLDVLHRLDVAEDVPGVAVAVNDAVVPRREWVSHRLSSGDVIEIIRAVQGG